MDREAEKHIPYSGNSYLSEFFDAMKKRDTLRSQITALKTEDEEINDKIFSFEKKICEYVQEGMKIAYERLNNCSLSTICTLAEHDNTGIFLYFKHLSANFCEDTTIDWFSGSESDRNLCFGYGRDFECGGNRILIPMEMMTHYERCSPRDFSDKIIELCKKSVEKLQENLKALSFEK